MQLLPSSLGGPPSPMDQAHVTPSHTQPSPAVVVNHHAPRTLLWRHDMSPRQRCRHATVKPSLALKLRGGAAAPFQKWPMRHFPRPKLLREKASLHGQLFMGAFYTHAPGFTGVNPANPPPLCLQGGLKPASGARASTCFFPQRFRYLDPLNGYLMARID